MPAMHQRFIDSLLSRRKECLVDSIKKLNQDMVSLRLVPFKKRLKFRPGQLVAIDNQLFAIGSDSAETELVLYAKVGRPFVSKLLQLHQGDHVSVYGPYGELAHRKDPQRPVIMISNHSGITAFLPYLLKAEPTEMPITCIHSVTEKSEELKVAAAVTKKNVRYILHENTTHGLLSAEVIRNYANGKFESSDYYLCGPKSMIEHVSYQLTQAGIPKQQILWDEF